MELKKVMEFFIGLMEKKYKGGFLAGKPDGNGKFYYNDNIINN